MSTSHPVIIERIRIGLLIASLTLLAACSATNPGASVQPSITKEAAQVRILEYFADTLTVLPAQATLSWESPTPGSDSLGPGITVPCNDNDQTDTGAVNLQLDYWIHGMPKGDGINYFESVSKVFADKGWSPQRDIRGPQRIVRGYTNDGYSLIAQLNVHGDLSLTGSSPCFPKANDHSTTPQPSTVPHP